MSLFKNALRHLRIFWGSNLFHAQWNLENLLATLQSIILTASLKSAGTCTHTASASFVYVVGERMTPLKKCPSSVISCLLPKTQMFGMDFIKIPFVYKTCFEEKPNKITKMRAKTSLFCFNTNKFELLPKVTSSTS